ncbi:MAG: hypothetical protein IPK16_24335 [Anaerolineales bacterium]|nr:hypothetical protein [Anaerolineales bacterium]
MVALDSDVLLLAFAFHRDERQPDNDRFLNNIRTTPHCVTIYSVMEILGQLSFNLSAERLQSWPSWLRDEFGLNVLYPDWSVQNAESFFLQEFVDGPLGKMVQRVPYLDSLILNLIEASPGLTVFVTWNARHFQGKTSLQVVTPAQYIESKQ